MTTVADFGARDVEVAKCWQPRCKVTGCVWAGDLHPTYEKANEERLSHLEEHRQRGVTDAWVDGLLAP